MYRTIEELDLLMVSHKVSIQDAVLALNKVGLGIIIIIDNNKNIIGILTDGDLRSLMLGNYNMDLNIKEVMNSNPIVLDKSQSNKREIESTFIKNSIFQIPITMNKKLIDVVHISDLRLTKAKKQKIRKNIDIPAVIMAGGKGSRLDPFTRILPKPLIPIGNDSIVKIIIDNFVTYGIKDVYLTLNDKKEMIKAYFKELELSCNIDYVEESIPLGTAGSLKLLEDKVADTFFLSNCDIIIKEDLSSIYDYHVKKNNKITIVCAMTNHTVPYGVCDIENGGEFIRMREKPNFSFLCNTGFYIIDKEVIELIPDDKIFNMTDLIEKSKNLNLNIGVFPISQNSWVDIGQWREYKNAVKSLEGDKNL